MCCYSQTVEVRKKEVKKTTMHFYTFPCGEVKYHGLLELTATGLPDDGTPIEDFEDYLLSREKTDTPFEDFIKNIEEVTLCT